MIAELIRWVGELGLVSVPEIAERFELTAGAARKLASSAGLLGRGDGVRMLACPTVAQQLARAGVAAPTVVVPVPRVILTPLDVRSAPWQPIWACRNWPVDDSKRRIKLKPPTTELPIDALRKRYKFLQPLPTDTATTRAYRAKTERRFVACLRDIHGHQPAHTATKYDFNRLYTSTHRQLKVLRARERGTP